MLFLRNEYLLKVIFVSLSVKPSFKVNSKPKANNKPFISNIRFSLLGVYLKANNPSQFRQAEAISNVAHEIKRSVEFLDREL